MPVYHCCSDCLIQTKLLLMQDVAEAEGQVSASLLQRLILKPQKIQQLADGIRAIAAQEEPIRRVLQRTEVSDGEVAKQLEVGKWRLPLARWGVMTGFRAGAGLLLDWTRYLKQQSFEGDAPAKRALVNCHIYVTLYKTRVAEQLLRLHTCTEGRIACSCRCCAVCCKEVILLYHDRQKGLKVCFV